MIILLIVLVIGAFILERYSLTHALDNVKYEVTPKRRLVECDEVLTVETTLENSGRLPRMYIRMSELFPYDWKTKSQSETLEDRKLYRVMRSVVYLMPRQRLVRLTEGSLPRRGRYYISGAYLAGGDFLGLSEHEQQFQTLKEIIVAPKPVEINRLDKLMGSFIGEISVNRFIFEDPVLTLGFREYTGREPMRSISWTQTAKVNRLMVKNYDFTLDLSVTVIMNIDYSGENTENVLEWVFSATRTVCERLENKSVPYTLITNADNVGLGARESIMTGLGRDHFLGILELLGRANYYTFENFERLLRRTKDRAEQGRSHILITPNLPENANADILALKRRTGSEIMTLVYTPEQGGDKHDNHDIS